MRCLRLVLLAFCVLTALCSLFTARCASADDGTPAAPTPSPAPPAGPPSPWMFVPVVSSSPKLGTAGGGLGSRAAADDSVRRSPNAG